MSSLPQYRAARTSTQERAKLVCKLPHRKLEAVDEFGVAAGMPSRTATVRRLQREGLKAANGDEAGR
jgi:hypothetical protein